MDPLVGIGLLLALATAVASIVGFLFKHRGAVESPAVEWRRPLRTSLGLFRSKWYTLGILIATASWGLHVAALTLAPISLVQSDRLFGFTVTRREWIGVALTAAGLAFLAATLEGGASERHSDYDALTLGAYVGAVGTLGLTVGAAARGTPRAGVAFAASAGLLWGASDVSIKALSDHVGDGLLVLAHPLAAVIALASLLGLVVSARSLQVGKAVPVIAVTAAAANVSTIASGPIVFGEPLPADTLGVVVRLMAFALVIGAAALTPPPVGVARAELA